MSQAPARLHVLLAADAPLGVVLRRGPSQCVCTMLWDRRTDEFSLGQWLRGRVYEQRSDLSPDGRHLVYFATKQGWRSYTAVSRAPYLRAVVFEPGCGTWSGGGVFTGPGTVCLDAREPETFRQLEAEGLSADQRAQVFNHRSAWVPSHYHWRLLRDGWQAKRGGVYERPLPGGWLLRKDCSYDWQYGPLQSHRLCQPTAGVTIRRRHWTWAERDGERLVWADAGRLWAGRIGERGLCDERCLYDFNDMTFEAVKAPYEGLQVQMPTPPWQR